MTRTALGALILNLSLAVGVLAISDPEAALDAAARHLNNQPDPNRK